MTDRELEADEWVSRALKILKNPLNNFVNEHMSRSFGQSWEDRCGAEFDNDIAGSLKVFIDNYGNVFGKVLRNKEPLDLAHRIRGLRNHWAHDGEMNNDYAQSSLYFVGRFLVFIDFREEAKQVNEIRTLLVAKDRTIDEINQRKIEAKVYSELNQGLEVQIKPPSYAQLERNGRLIAEFVTPELCAPRGLRQVLGYMTVFEHDYPDSNGVQRSFITSHSRPWLSFSNYSLPDRLRFSKSHYTELIKESGKIALEALDCDAVVKTADIVKQIIGKSTHALAEGILTAYTCCLDPESKDILIIDNPVESLLKTCFQHGLSLQQAFTVATAFPSVLINHPHHPKPLFNLLCGVPLLCGEGTESYVGFAWYANSCSAMDLEHWKHHRLDRQVFLDLLDLFEIKRRQHFIESALVGKLKSKLADLGAFN